MTISVQRTDDQVVIQISGEFTFRMHKEFRQAYLDVPRDSEVRFVVDFSNTTFMDSSAFGMLLILLEYAGGEQKRVTLANSHGVVHKLLQVTHFGTMFTIIP